MCLAIGPLCPARRSALGRAWWHIARQPQRLFVFSSVIHGLIYLVLALSRRVPWDVYQLSSGIFLTHGLIGFAALGLLLSRVPVWFKTSEISYARYAASYNFAFVGLLFMELGWLWSANWGLVGYVLLLIAWWLAIRALHRCYFWGLKTGHVIHRALLWLLYLNFVSLLSTSVCLIFYIDRVCVALIWWINLVSMSLLLLLCLLVFVRQHGLQHEI